jgi:hypothetical protein
MITAESLAQKLQHAEASRDEALRAAQHWEGRAAQLRELLAEVNRVDTETPHAQQSARQQPTPDSKSVAL